MASVSQAMSLTGRAALVTGAGVGLGRAIALALAEAGAFVGVHYHRSASEADQTLTQVKQYSDGLAIQADLTDESQAKRTVADFVAAAGRMDILVNNAGALVARSTIEDCSLDLWRKTFDVNMTSAFLVTRSAIPHLRTAGSGQTSGGGHTASIINIISLSTQTGGANGGGAYAAAKGAMQVFTRTLAKELAPQVRSNAICPGVIETIHHETHSTPERMAEYRKQTPLGRNGCAEEVATTALYLAGDGAAFTNGALIDVNGGRFLR